MPAGYRWPLAGAWLVLSLHEYRVLQRGGARIHRYTLDALDNVVGIAIDGQRRPLRLMGGSVVLPRLAWLRLQFPDGSHYVELLRGDPRVDLNWQRLQLIWQARRLVIGDPPGS
jgi:hypothetical protein